MAKLIAAAGILLAGLIVGYIWIRLGILEVPPAADVTRAAPTNRPALAESGDRTPGRKTGVFWFQRGDKWIEVKMGNGTLGEVKVDDENNLLLYAAAEVVEVAAGEVMVKFAQNCESSLSSDQITAGNARVCQEGKFQIGEVKIRPARWDPQLYPELRLGSLADIESGDRLWVKGTAGVLLGTAAGEVDLYATQ